MPRLTLKALSSIMVLSLLGSIVCAVKVAAKDRGPESAACDRFEKSSPAWRACAERAPAAAGPATADAQRFYAGYWLAKNGRYEEALDHLKKATIKNARVLTYIGFATRKLGRIDEAIGYYSEALQKDPGNVIAHSYLGEAHLARNDLASALAELRKVEAGCGRDCDAYTELAERIGEYRAASSQRG
ncbi:MAG: tetratricopeptide repeat protein [Alphaproteobacteria bacterium]|nr:tetratricopeptide repeat protein [Alphaproteobacteria bacterium]